MSSVRKRRRQIRREHKLKIWARDNYTCQYCWKYLELEECTTDHVLSLKRGGTNDSSNLVTACLECNRKKARWEQPIHIVNSYPH